VTQLLRLLHGASQAVRRKPRKPKVTAGNGRKQPNAEGRSGYRPYRR